MGGFSIVQAEINLVKRALQNEKYLKYVLLSGADYPIKDNEYIYNYFKKNSSVEFIRGIDLDQIKHKEFYYKHIDVYQNMIILELIGITQLHLKFLEL